MRLEVALIAEPGDNIDNFLKTGENVAGNLHGLVNYGAWASRIKNPKLFGHFNDYNFDFTKEPSAVTNMRLFWENKLKS